MDASSSKARGRPLEALGISEIEERVYEAMLDHSGATLSDLERELALPARKLMRIVDALEQKGLVTRTSSRPHRHIPASPDIAVEALVLRRQDELRRARAEIQRLQERAAASVGEQRQMIELVTTREAERHVFEQMQQAAQHELIFLERPPILIAGPEQPNETEMKALSRGVRYRSIADHAFLELPGVLTRVREDMAGGRGNPRRLEAAVQNGHGRPQHRADPAEPRAARQPDDARALVGAARCVVCDVRTALEQGRADRVHAQRRAQHRRSRLARAGGRRAAAAAACGGLNDKAIAHELGMSASTLNRRIAELMKSVDARSRFQLGWLARVLSGSP